VNIAYHILLTLSISPDLSIVLFWWTRHLGKEELSYIHARPEDDRDRVHIREFEGDIEIVAWIDESCSIMDDQSESCQ
jgi:hypothetical protein